VDVGLLFIAGWVGMLVTSLNLFPVGQLDGGHAIYAISRRAHRFTARLTLAGLFALILAQLLDGRFPSYVLWFVILAFMRDRHPRLLDESQSLGGARIAIAVVLLVIFVLSFIPVPFTVL
jgi:membrane-associated protease RseP (regulator of RpoE activity)